MSQTPATTRARLGYIHRVRRLILPLCALAACSDGDLATAGGLTGTGSTTGDPPVDATDPSSPTTGTTTGTTTDDPTTQGPTTQAPTTADDPTTGPPSACAGTVSGSLWLDVVKHKNDLEGDVGRGLAVDGLGRLYYTTRSGTGTANDIIVRSRGTLGDAQKVIDLEGDGQQLPAAIAVDDDGSVVYLAAGDTAFAVQLSDGATLWERASGPLLIYRDVLADPLGGVFLRAGTGGPNNVVSLDPLGGERFKFDDDADGSEQTGFTQTADGGLILGFGTFTRSLNNVILVRKYTAGTNDIAWQQLHPRDAGIDYGSIVEAPDGALYIVGEESENALGGGPVLLHRLGPTGALEWSRQVAVNPKPFRHALARVVALPDGDALVGLAPLSTLFRVDVGGEPAGEIDLDDGLGEGLGIALHADRCSVVSFLRIATHELNNIPRTAYSLGRLVP
jgi:hypothetical protein